MIITALRRAKHSARTLVFVDDEFECSISEALIFEYKLFQGKSISESTLQKLKDDAIVQKLIEDSIRLISKRPRSTKEITLYLEKKLVTYKRKGCKFKEQVLTSLRQKGYLDDRNFAKWWVDQRLAYKPRGRYLLQNELKEKGIPQDIISEVFGGIRLTPKKELSIAHNLAKKKRASMGSMNIEKNKRRLYNYLLRKGFS